MNPTEITAPPPICKAHAGMDSPLERGQQDKPCSIYQVHLDSWRRVPEEQNRPLTEAEIGPQLAEYLCFLRFSHVEFLSLGRSGSPRPDTVTRCLREAGVEVLPDAGSSFVSPWDRDWAYRTLSYFGYDPLYRKLHHDLISERADQPVGNLVLPLSHELVTQDMPSLLARMPGDEWQKFANLRLLFSYITARPKRPCCGSDMMPLR